MNFNFNFNNGLTLFISDKLQLQYSTWDWESRWRQPIALAPPKSAPISV